MKTKTNLFKLCVLLFGISFLLWNCEDDNIIKPQSETEQRRLNISIVSFEHFKSVNAKALANIAPIKQEGLSQRIVESSMYDFFIDDERVQVIEKENYTTYTFNVLRDTVVEGELENYMYKEFNDGTYKQFLLTYYYSLDEDGEKVFNLTDMGVELEIVYHILLRHWTV